MLVGFTAPHRDKPKRDNPEEAGHNPTASKTKILKARADFHGGSMVALEIYST
jgi:hypothetical protein